MDGIFTKAEEKEYIKMVPRFREIVCGKMCNYNEHCKTVKKEDKDYMVCPWFNGYHLCGWPVKKLSDYSYNAKPLPDLRTEELDLEFYNEWKKKN